MTEIEIRLEVLKLAHTHGRETAAVIERAEAYEAYVTGPTAKAVPRPKTLTLPSGKEPATPKGAG